MLAGKTRRNFNSLRFGDLMELVPTDHLVEWVPPVTPREPSDIIRANFDRFRAFDLRLSEAAKVMIIDTVLAEVVPSYPNLKVWKSIPLEDEMLVGVADYLISPQYMSVKAPLLCAVEAKKDKFVQGTAQCVGEMVACRSVNQRSGFAPDIYGIVSNGEKWVFYRLSPEPALYETKSFDLDDLPELLGVLHTVCAACTANIPAKY